MQTIETPSLKPLMFRWKWQKTYFRIERKVNEKWMETGESERNQLTIFFVFFTMRALLKWVSVSIQKGLHRCMRAESRWCNTKRNINWNLIMEIPITFGWQLFSFHSIPVFVERQKVWVCVCVHVGESARYEISTYYITFHSIFSLRHGWRESSTSPNPLSIRTFASFLFQFGLCVFSSIFTCVCIHSLLNIVWAEKSPREKKREKNWKNCVYSENQLNFNFHLKRAHLGVSVCILFYSI